MAALRDNLFDYITTFSIWLFENVWILMDIKLYWLRKHYFFLTRITQQQKFSKPPLPINAIFTSDYSNYSKEKKPYTNRPLKE